MKCWERKNLMRELDLDAPFREPRALNEFCALGIIGLCEVGRRVSLFVIWLPAKLAVPFTVALSISEVFKAAQYWQEGSPENAVRAAIVIPVSFVVAGAILRLRAWLRMAGRMWM